MASTKIASPQGTKAPSLQCRSRCASKKGQSRPCQVAAAAHLVPPVATFPRVPSAPQSLHDHYIVLIASTSPAKDGIGVKGAGG